MNEQNNNKLKVACVVLGVLLAASVAAIASVGFGPLGSSAAAADTDTQKTALTVAAPQDAETSVKTEISIGEAKATGATDKKEDVKDSAKKSTTSNSSTSKPAEQKSTDSGASEQKPDQNTEQSNDNAADRLSNDYIFSDSSSRLLTDTDISGMSAKELNYAKNEIYARHGRIFDSIELADYFKSKSWYEGTRSPDDFDESLLNDTEKKNIAFLQKAEYELEPGGYQPK